MKFAQFSAEGFPVAFYTSEIHGLPAFDDDEAGEENPRLPADVVAITDGEWIEFLENPGRRRWGANRVEAFEPEPVPEPVPEAVTNSDFRVALLTWAHPETGAPRFDEVDAKVRAAGAAGSIEGRIALARWEYANNVNRSELLRLRGAFGFTEAEVDEAMFRAAAVSNPASAG